MKKLFLLILTAISINASIYDFDIYKKGKEQNNTLLVIGGIHGDEPGGYFSASVLASSYSITKGSLWIVPNLNFDSLLRNRRGIYGDMNRKFNIIKDDDSDLKSVKKIKEIILDKSVDLVLNLHDGRGFYRQNWENSIFNPHAWGQACIIDQYELTTPSKYGNLNEIAQKVSKNINNSLIENFHKFNIKNTDTKEKDEEMKHSLTYFAITNNKPAFAIETSKNIDDLVHKVQYQLKAIEGFMHIMGIEFKRSFDLNDLKELENIVYDFGKVSINGVSEFDLNSIKKIIRFLPLKTEDNNFKFSNPLGGIVKYKSRYDIMIGNKRVSSFYPQIFEFCTKKDSVKLDVDGKFIEVEYGTTVKVNKNFVIKNSDLRVNIIGFSRQNLDSESGIKITKKDIATRFSISDSKELYRVEFYNKENQFCGMILIEF